jgi:phosphohistidine phosphatase
MKTLTLLRHAKSGDDGLVARDFDRRLNAKGRRAAHAIGRWMKNEGLAFDAVLASPATRVQETLAEVADGLGAPLTPRFDKRLYLATADDLLDAVQAAPASADRLLVAGHNPGLERLVLALVPDGDGPRGAVEEKYPTASVAEIAFDIGEWSAVTAGAGRLARFMRPRDLDPALGPDAA